jgi:hypothetical protein
MTDPLSPPDLYDKFISGGYDDDLLGLAWDVAVSWRRAGRPQLLLSRERWLELLAATGYVVDGLLEPAGCSEAPPVLYRGATLETARWMTWTTNPRLAQIYGAWPDHKVWAIFPREEWVLGRFWGDWIVNVPSGALIKSIEFPDNEPEERIATHLGEIVGGVLRILMPDPTSPRRAIGARIARHGRGLSLPSTANPAGTLAALRALTHDQSEEDR